MSGQPIMLVMYLILLVVKKQTNNLELPRMVHNEKTMKEFQLNSAFLYLWRAYVDYVRCNLLYVYLERKHISLSTTDPKYLCTEIARICVQRFVHIPSLCSYIEISREL